MLAGWQGGRHLQQLAGQGSPAAGQFRATDVEESRAVVGGCVTWFADIDEDIIYHASVVTYKLVHHNPFAQHMFIRQNGLEIINQLLRDYDLDIQVC